MMPTISSSRLQTLLLTFALGACGGACGNSPPSSSEPSEVERASETLPATAAADRSSAEIEEDAEEATAPASAAPPSFDIGPWGELLDRYVTDDGGFRYAALVASEADREALAGVVRAIGEADPATYPSREAKLAFYINAYNVLTVATVVERFPIDSVMSVEGFFDVITHRVADREMTLNALENEIIRAEFEEPRIHFAVNCASAGCPWLDGTPFTAENIDAALDRLTRSYVQRTSVLERSRRRVRVSKIFEWFEGDFERAGGVREFLAAHLEPDDAAFVRESRTRIGHFEYDWALNARD